MFSHLHLSQLVDYWIVVVAAVAAAEILLPVLYRSAQHDKQFLTNSNFTKR